MCWCRCSRSPRLRRRPPSVDRVLLLQSRPSHSAASARCRQPDPHFTAAVRDRPGAAADASLADGIACSRPACASGSACRSCSSATAWIMLPATLLCRSCRPLWYAGPNGPDAVRLVAARRLVADLPARHFAANRSVSGIDACRTAAGHGRPMLLSEIAAVWPLKLHAVCHGLALIGVGPPCRSRPMQVWLTQVGSAIGFVGAIALAWFTADVCDACFARAPDRMPAQRRRSSESDVLSRIDAEHLAGNGAGRHRTTGTARRR